MAKKVKFHGKSLLHIVLVGMLLFIVSAISVALWNHSNIYITVRQPSGSVGAIPERFYAGEVKKDIEYCNDQHLDLYEPQTVLYDKQPLLIFIHGGGWNSNNKTGDADIRHLFDGLRKEGFAVASVGYRLAPMATFPVPQQDVFCAVRFLRANSVRFSLDPDKFAVAGLSAGGNLASLVGVHDGKGIMQNGIYQSTSSRVSAVVSIAGVYDFTRNLLPNSIRNIGLLMQQKSRSLGSPVNYVSPGDPPFLIFRGDKDTIGLAAQDEVFIKALRNAKVPVEKITVTNADHNLKPSGGERKPTNAEIEEIITNFVKAKLDL